MEDKLEKDSLAVSTMSSFLSWVRNILFASLENIPADL